MRFLALIFGLLLIWGCRERLPPPPESFRSSALLEELRHDLSAHDYLGLALRLDQRKTELDSLQARYFQVFVYNGGNRNPEAIREGEELLLKDSARLTDSCKSALLHLLSDAYFKIFQYRASGHADHQILERYARVSDSGSLAETRNHLMICQALAHEAAQTVDIPDSSVIAWTRDRLGLIEIPLSCRGETYEGIFDTRANISSISQTMARRMGLRMMDLSYEEGSSTTGIRFKTGLGIADSLLMGHLLFRHVLFQVMPDSILYIAPIHFSLNIIIGIPVIAAMGQVDLYKEGRMVIPLHPVPGRLRNFFMDGLDPIIVLRKGPDTLNFHFDLGATSSVLYAAFFDRYQPEILRHGLKKNVEFGGAGGVRTKEVYILPSLKLQLGESLAVLDSVSVMTRKIYPQEKFYGNLGQDLIAGFRELILNFQDMYVECR
jgi:hypothetical protein